jgi:hypothetical protein
MTNIFALNCKTALRRALSYLQGVLRQISEIPGRERALPPRPIYRPLPFSLSQTVKWSADILGIIRIIVRLL